MLNRASKSGEAQSLTGRTVFLLVVFLLLVAVTSSTVTYAWISRNHNVNVKDVNMRYEVDNLDVGGVEIGDKTITLVDPDTTASGSGSDDNLIPGSVLTMKLGIANEGSVTRYVKTLGFEDVAIWRESDEEEHPYASLDKANFDEIPIVYKGEYYYLGTQLTISSDSYTVYKYEEQQATNDDGSLMYDNDGNPVYKKVIVETVETVTLTAMTPVYMTTISDDGTVTPTLVIRSDLNITLPENHLIAFDVVITFVETNEEQNAYNNFGSGATGDKSQFIRTLTIGATFE